MTDIAPELWEKISSQFEKALKNDKEIAGLYEKIRSGKATYEEAELFSQRIGKLSSMALTDNITAEVLPDGKMYFNIAERTVRPALERDYELISDVSAEVQASLNEAAGIGMNPVIPEMNEDRLSGLIDKLTEDGKPFDDVQSFLGDPVMNFCQNIVDESVRANAEMHYESGLSPKIKRIMTGHKTCKFCIERAGEHKYPLEDNEVYRRHENCRCLVLYDPGDGKYQDVHSKKYFTSEREAIKENMEKRNASQNQSDAFLKQKNKAKAEGKKYVDATEFWGNRQKNSQPDVIDTKDYFVVDGKSLPVNGEKKEVEFSPSENERIIARWYSGKTGEKIQLMPKINKPEYHPLGDLREVKTGLFIDIKSPTGNSKKTIIKRLVDGKHQARNFIVDLSNCPLSDEEAIRQAETLMDKDDWFEQLVIIRGQVDKRKTIIEKTIELVKVIEKI